MAYTICFLATIVVLVSFLTFGLLNVKKGQSYFNCDKQLNSREFRNSFAAATTSLATVLFYFVVLGLNNGLWILIFSPLSLLVGTMLFNWFILPQLMKQKYGVSNDGGISAGNTLGEYIKLRYDSQPVKYVVLTITLLGILSIMLIELFVGVTIFNIFIDINPELANIAELLGLIFISTVSFVYTGLGGLNAVVKTDKIQYWFMLITAIFLVAYLFIKHTDSIKLLTSDVYFPTFCGKDGLWKSNWPLFVNTIFVNIFLIPALLRNWQLIAATKNGREIKKGMWSGWFLTFLVTALFLFFGLFFYHIYPTPSNGDTPSLYHILTTMANSGDLILSNILFPLLFVACLMALLSTVDSSLLPIVQSLVVDIIPNDKSNYKSKIFEIYKRIYNHINLVCIIAILFLTIFLYLIVFKLLKFELIDWLFTIFSVVTISCPAILVACFGKDTILRTKLMQKTVIFSTILGLLIAGGISLYGNYIQSTSLIQLNTPFAMLVSIICICIVYFYIKFIKKS